MGKISLVLLAIFVSAATANTRTCFCHIGTSTNRSPVLLDVPNPSYSHWLSLSCSEAKSKCPDDCRRNAAIALGGSVNPIDNDAGNEACELLGREVSAEEPVHLYAHYDTSNCDHVGYQYLGEGTQHALHSTFHLGDPACPTFHIPPREPSMPYIPHSTKGPSMPYIPHSTKGTSMPYIPHSTKVLIRQCWHSSEVYSSRGLFSIDSLTYTPSLFGTEFQALFVLVGGDDLHKLGYHL
uniref:Uncharacterized protein n=1 Tax=Branchiostoma floridae TaxID=7739 RepID=C3ZTQ3_BRAFL|eukprot:XP_002588040.1 hypothetical protein BRAFLDRAFT_83020 [Branchiostoma floridae]